MKERGILFRDRLVRRIVDRDSPKTQTRRIVKPQPGSDIDNLGDGSTIIDMATGRHITCPYGEIGDRLWVREAWRSWRDTCDGGDTADDHECAPHCDQTYVAFRATPRVGFRPMPDRQAITYLDDSSPIDSDKRLLGPWKPGIHLRRDWARIWLEVVSVRVERLQAISAVDAIAEGVELGVPLDAIVNGELTKVHYFDARTAFAHLWCSVNGQDAWKTNPFVWRVEFKLITDRGAVPAKEAA